PARPSRKDGERTPADPPAVAVRRAPAETRPDIPAVAAVDEPVAMPSVTPDATKLHVRFGRPSGEDLLVAAEQLHVVVAGPFHRWPAQQRRSPQSRPKRRLEP